MGRFQLELIYFYYLFFQLSTVQSRRQKKLQHPTKPFENVVLTTKGLQDRKTTIEWDDGGKIGNKNKSNLTSHR